MRKILPWLLVAIPILYYFALLAGAATYPGYDHMTRYASELGAAGAPYPAIFNVSIIVMGLAAMAAAIPLYGELARLGGGKTWPALACACLALWGVSMVMGGSFPMPDDRHGGFGLGLGAPLIPLFTMLSLRKAAGRDMLLFLGLVFVASAVMLAIMFGVGSLVTRANVGLFQRVNTFVSIPWIAVLGIWLLRREAEANSRPFSGAG